MDSLKVKWTVNFNGGKTYEGWIQSYLIDTAIGSIVAVIHRDDDELVTVPIEKLKVVRRG